MHRAPSLALCLLLLLLPCIPPRSARLAPRPLEPPAMRRRPLLPHVCHPLHEDGVCAAHRLKRLPGQLKQLQVVVDRPHVRLALRVCRQRELPEELPLVALVDLAAVDGDGTDALLDEVHGHSHGALPDDGAVFSIHDGREVEGSSADDVERVDGGVDEARDAVDGVVVGEGPPKRGLVQELEGLAAILEGGALADCLHLELEGTHQGSQVCARGDIGTPH
mmetsp:Transcript_46916/g.117564  ORF Transcript_46916/g.117564 Transcript_46916/m.117564 type:complete len:221 (-) Transcript_46916:826-1488(-)